MMYERIVEWLQSHGAIRGRVPDSDAEIYERVTDDGLDPVPETNVESPTDNETASPPERTRSGGQGYSVEPVPDVALHDWGDESNARVVSADTIYPWDSDDETEPLDEDEINDLRNIIDGVEQDISVSANTEDGVQINGSNSTDAVQINWIHDPHPGIEMDLDDE